MDSVEDKEQRQSKKWKNRARKEGKNYGVQVPPSSFIKDEKEKGGEDCSRIRITVFLNGDKSKGKAVVFTSDSTLEQVTKLACNKLRLKYNSQKKMFTDEGKEITSLSEIQQDDNLFLSKKEEEFIQMQTPEDQISVRGTVADLKFDFVNICDQDKNLHLATETQQQSDPNATETKQEEGKIGKIALHHRPKVQHLHVLEQNGCTHLLTLLSQKEKAQQIGTVVLERQNTFNQKTQWIWLPLSGADPPQQLDLIYFIAEKIKEVVKVLREGGCVVVHCAAGVHRTGMITNAILRYMGFNKEEAREMLLRMRKITGEECGTHRLDWAEKFLEVVGTEKEPKNIHVSKLSKETI